MEKSTNFPSMNFWTLPLIIVAVGWKLQFNFIQVCRHRNPMIQSSYCRQCHFIQFHDFYTRILRFLINTHGVWWSYQQGEPKCHGFRDILCFNSELGGLLHLTEQYSDYFPSKGFLYQELVPPTESHYQFSIHQSPRILSVKGKSASQTLETWENGTLIYYSLWYTTSPEQVIWNKTLTLPLAKSNNTRIAMKLKLRH